MTRFLTLEVEGFGLLCAPTTLDLSKPGVTVVKGPNGIGKTTRFSALCWALYGETLKGSTLAGIPTFAHLRGPDWRGTRVRIRFEQRGVIYTIARHLGFKGETLPSPGQEALIGGDRLMIFKAGVLLGEELYKAGQQLFINDLLGMGWNAFRNAVVFGQRMTRLIAAPPEEKRRLFDEIFSVGFVELARKRGTERMAALSQTRLEWAQQHAAHLVERDGMLARIATEQGWILRWQQTHAVTVKTARTALASALCRMRANAEAIRHTTQQLQQLPSGSAQILSDALLPLHAALEAARKAVQSADHDLEYASGAFKRANVRAQHTAYDLAQLQRQLSALTVQKCVWCAQEVGQSAFEQEHARLTDAIAAYVQAAQEAANVLTLEQQTLTVMEVEQAAATLSEQHAKVQFDAATQALEAFQLLSGQRTGLEAELSGYTALSLELARAVTAARLALTQAQQEPPPQDGTQNLAVRARQCEAQALVLFEQIAQLDQEMEKVRWWVEKGYGASGVRAYVFGAMLEQLNAAVVQYAAHFGLSARFTVDASKERLPFMTEIFRAGHPIPHRELSGGEQQRIDLCLAFALHDVVGGANPTNLLILDEVTEGIDTYGGTEQVMDLIVQKAGMERTVFVITHAREFILPASRTLELL